MNLDALGLQRHGDQTLTGEQLAAITREMVRIKSKHFGRGATEGKSYQCDDFLFCVLKGA